MRLQLAAVQTYTGSASLLATRGTSDERSLYQARPRRQVVFSKKAKDRPSLFQRTGMVFCGVSPTRFFQSMLRSYYRMHGLTPRTIHIDSQTSMLCWVPKDASIDPSADGKAPPGKPPLLLLHGFGAHAIWQWTGQIGALLRIRQVYMPDLVFFGGSRSSSPDRTEHFQADCVIKMMDILRVDSFDVVGISYGGFVAVRVAERLPTRVKRVCLTDAGIGITEEEHSESLRHFGVKDITELILAKTPDDVRRLLYVAWCKPPHVPRFLLRDALEVLFQDQVDEKRGLLLEIAKYSSNPPDPLLPMQQKVLLMWGEHDPVFPLAVGHRLKNFLGDRGKLVVLEKACHLANVQRSKKFNAALLEFLEKGLHD